MLRDLVHTVLPHPSHLSLPHLIFYLTKNILRAQISLFCLFLSISFPPVTLYHFSSTGMEAQKAYLHVPSLKLPEQIRLNQWIVFHDNFLMFFFVERNCDLQLLCNTKCIL